MIHTRLRELWPKLQGSKPRFPHFLSYVRVENLRGIAGLRVGFEYPVSVIAGGNASGKSTLLFAAACAYRVPGAGPRNFFPSTLFPDYRPDPKLGGREDQRGETVIQFDYVTPETTFAMQWRRSKGWNRNYLGRKNVSQPSRHVYLRTLSNLSNPSEVRGVLAMSRLKEKPPESPMTASQVEFAHQMLPFRYSEVVQLSGSSKTLLFARQESGAAYSELHMSAGERAMLRLSQEIAQRRDALILIDEVEAGLHPWVQELLMLHLQQLALRNNLQVIVTTHSLAVLNAVPENARIFLDRSDEKGISVVVPYRDIVQNALYGRSGEALNVLCEDKVAEGVLQGVLDVLLVRHRIRMDSVKVGRDTGADEFAAHAAAFRKFGKLGNFVFVLDGDKRGSAAESKLRSKSENLTVLFLPGDVPETWVWENLRKRGEVVGEAFGMNAEELDAKIRELDSTYALASDSPSEIAKRKLGELAHALRADQSPMDVARMIARAEAKDPASDIQALVDGLETELIHWRDTDLLP